MEDEIKVAERDRAVAYWAVEILNVLERRRAADQTELLAESERGKRFRHVEGRVAAAEEAKAATELARWKADADQALRGAVRGAGGGTRAGELQADDALHWQQGIIESLRVGPL